LDQPAGGLLIALLQRAPVVQVTGAAEEFVVSSPIGVLLKSVAAAVASLGALDSLAGATQLSVSPNQNPGTATVGTSKTIFFTVVVRPRRPAPGLIVAACHRA